MTDNLTTYPDNEGFKHFVGREIARLFGYKNTSQFVGKSRGLKVRLHTCKHDGTNTEGIFFGIRFKDVERTE